MKKPRFSYIPVGQHMFNTIKSLGQKGRQTLYEIAQNREVIPVGQHMAQKNVCTGYIGKPLGFGEIL